MSMNNNTTDHTHNGTTNANAQSSVAGVTVGANNASANWTPRYLNFIIGIKE
jgi:hypothetical protein